MNTNGYSLPVDIWSLGCTIFEMSTSKPPWSQFEGVAAIFKIGNSKDHLSTEAKSFIKLCLQRDPVARPTATRLLDHPFVRDQATTRTTNISVTRDAFPYTFDRSHTPPASELHPSRTSVLPGGPAGAMNVRALIRNPRDDVRMITSLPVSPCSSPLRQVHKSRFLSPPHPSYPPMGQNANGYNLSDYSVSPSRPTTYVHDHFLKDKSLADRQEQGLSEQRVYSNKYNFRIHFPQNDGTKTSS